VAGVYDRRLEAGCGRALSVALGTGGAFSIRLVPNAGANPDGTFYKVVLKLDDGTSETETWVIPSSSTAVTIAAVEATVVPSSVALQVASRQYVDNAVAAKAADSGVVHIAGQETISGIKRFLLPRVFPLRNRRRMRRTRLMWTSRWRPLGRARLWRRRATS
jgi:hypothetical protein